ncbi:homeobox KN domain-containing protein [Scheffersomyces amazonensis]|uniref:homeobox KN domain-containing protein n=1 Tax=Scheffersomyces amazonensis TaxID=1078765 RepID=UPI00315D5289
MMSSSNKISLPPISDILLPPSIHHLQHQQPQVTAPPPPPAPQQQSVPIQPQRWQPQHPAGPPAPHLRNTRSLLPPINSVPSNILSPSTRYLPSTAVPGPSYEGNIPHATNNYYYTSIPSTSSSILTPTHSLVNSTASLSARSPLSHNSSPASNTTSGLASPPLRQTQSHHALYQRHPSIPHPQHHIHPMVQQPPLYKPNTSTYRNSSIGEISDEDEVSEEDRYKVRRQRERTGSTGSEELDANGIPSIKRKTRNNLPKEITYILLKWLNDHLNHPYPNSFEKNQLMMATGLNQQQLSNWFINARRRKIKSLKEQKRINLI